MSRKPRLKLKRKKTGLKSKRKKIETTGKTTEREVTEIEKLKLENIHLRKEVLEFKKAQGQLSLLYAQEKQQSAKMLEELTKMGQQDLATTEKKLHSEYTQLLDSSGIEDAMVVSKDKKLIIREMTEDEKKTREQQKILSGG